MKTHSPARVSGGDLLMRNRLYYHVKPYLPWRLRMGMRRIVARRTREVCKDIWPIKEAAGHVPEGWTGWPDGKKFALVLTHDVESFGGLVKCFQLMELERSLGFRSSFNFIPEGEYKVPRQLREELLRHGFEVGVHDLRHDGKLYWSANEFSQNARSINRYLKDWNASGFRSAFMLHDRKCLRELNIQYDASTFDTDPFEPQPDGANTIFPFWVSDGNGGGYVELPYTLPQDSTLFLVLDEKSPEIWIRKLKWIIARGGMVLLDAHPDYLGFDEKLDIAEYPSSYYEEFLRYIKTHYEGQYWNALPREVAGWFKENHRARTPAEYVAEIRTHRPHHIESTGFWTAIRFEAGRLWQNATGALKDKSRKFDFVDVAAGVLDIAVKSWIAIKGSFLKSAAIGRRGLKKSRRLTNNLLQKHLPALYRRFHPFLTKIAADARTMSSVCAKNTSQFASRSAARSKESFLDASRYCNRLLRQSRPALKNLAADLDRGRKQIWKSTSGLLTQSATWTRNVGKQSRDLLSRPKELPSPLRRPTEPSVSTRAVLAPVMDSRVIDVETVPAAPAPVAIRETVRPPLPLEGVHAAVVLYSYFSSDPRPRREAEALRQCGAEVDVICLRKSKAEPRFEEKDGIRIHRIPLKRRRSGKLVYITQYGWFLAAAFVRLTLWSFKKRYKLVHVHNMPDFLVFSALFPRLRGAKVILDLHDPMPELFRTIYNLPDRHFFVRGLKQVEKWSIGFAHLALTPNAAFKELFVSRSCRPGKIQTVMNSPETAIFNPAKYPERKYNGPKPFTLMYHGLLVERHGLDVAIRAVMRLRRRIPNIKLHMYGDRTDYLEKIMEHVWRTNLENHVEFHGYLPLPEIAENIMNIDLGLIPNRLSAFTEINFPTRIFEYLAMNKPLIVPSTLGIRDYFHDDEILYFEPGNPDDLARKIEWAFQHPQELKQMMEAGREVYRRNCWDLEREKFTGMVTTLVQPDSIHAEAVAAKKSFA